MFVCSGKKKKQQRVIEWKLTALGPTGLLVVALVAQMYFGDNDGKADFGKRLAPALDIAVGKWFTRVSDYAWLTTVFRLKELLPVLTVRL